MDNASCQLLPRSTALMAAFPGRVLLLFVLGQAFILFQDCTLDSDWCLPGQKHMYRSRVLTAEIMRTDIELLFSVPSSTSLPFMICNRNNRT